MLLQFSVSNFRAFREMQTLNLGASNYDKSLPQNIITPNLPGLKRQRWVKGSAIYGANASGKSSLLEAIEALANFVRQSAKTTDREDVIKQIEPFAFDPRAKSEPTAFALIFVSEGVRYEFRVAATRKRIIHESLRAYPFGKEQLWYLREWSEELGKHTFEPENPTGMPRDRNLEQSTLPNVLYLSKSIAENRAALEPVFRWIVRNLIFLDLSTKASLDDDFTLNRLQRNDSELSGRILRILRHADLGITGARSVDSPTPEPETLQFIEHFPPDLREHIRNQVRVEPQLSHRAPGGKSIPLPWKSESAGTHRFFSLIGPWLDILHSGYTVCIDELESSMHPLMVRELLRLFFNETENPKGAQILFTTHNPLLLDPTFLRRDQVWFTDKDDEGSSHLYPLTDYQPRQGESLVRGYLAGRYGGVPFVPEGLLGNFSAIETVRVEGQAE